MPTTDNNAITVNGIVVVDLNQDLYANTITMRSIGYRGFYGTNAGYSFGGANSAASPNPSTFPSPTPAPVFTLRTEIESFPFASASVTISSVGSISTTRAAITGHSSSTHGYAAGGSTSLTSASAYSNVIDRFPFTTPFVTASSVGTLATARGSSAGCSGDGYGFVCTGLITPATATNTVERFSFASGTQNGAVVSPGPSTRYSATGVSSGQNGYIVGATIPTPTTTVNIIKFPFYNTNFRTTGVGNLLNPGTQRWNVGGISSDTDGYIVGGQTSTTTGPSIGTLTTISKFPFATELTDAVDVGNLTTARSFMSTQSSDTFGYSLGGGSNGPSNYGNSPVSPVYLALANFGYTAQISTVERFPYATGTTSGSIGSLTTSKWGCAGAQY